MSMLKKKRLLIFLAFALLSITTACGNIDYDKKRLELVEETDLPVSSQNISTIEENSIESNESVDYEILISSEAKYEDLSVLDEETFSVIKEIKSKIDFFGTFKKEDIKSSESILKKYYEVIVGKQRYINKTEGNWEHAFDPLKVKDYTYYFFDMDKDESPELIVSDNTTYAYIFKYDISKNETLLIDTIRTTSQLLSDNKISNWHGGVGLTYGFYELDENGERKSNIRFYSAPYFNNITQQEDEIYMVGFPEDSDEIVNLKSFLKNKKIQIYFDDLTKTYYFKITKEQYNQLTKDYFESRKKAEENIREVAYTFEELFDY